MSGLAIFGAIFSVLLACVAIGLVVVLLFHASRGIGFLFKHCCSFLFGEVGDLARAVGAVLAGVVLGVLALATLLIGRFSRANHYASGMNREVAVLARRLWSMAVRRPLRLFFLHGLVEGLDQRVPQAVLGAPGPEQLGGKDQFPGYEVTGSLPSGGSGARLYTARSGSHGAVVIKSFSFEEGSTLPQIVRESRALDAARRLGLVLGSSMETSRFWYVMPYRAGEHLGTVVKHLHASSDGNGLQGAALQAIVKHELDLVQTLEHYHREGLWHKDVKPDNIIVEDGATHLVDLGLVTPLGSPLTLTTHGTEYFRDPEMVRLALGGVKVHQIDGAKFDVYAAGAVLYFMLEDTFPAHGGLSRFEKPAPEVLRWIVRRAMTDYESRYESARSMREDLEVVAAAADPFALRPAELPSVSGATVERPMAHALPPRRTTAPPPPPQKPSKRSKRSKQKPSAAPPAPLTPTGVRAPLVLLVLAVVAAVSYFVFDSAWNRPEVLPTLRSTPAQAPSGLGRFVVLKDYPTHVAETMEGQMETYLKSVVDRGWTCIDDDPAATAALTVAVNQSGAGDGGPFDPVIITLKRLDLDGVVWIHRDRDTVEAKLFVAPEESQLSDGPRNDRSSMRESADGIPRPLAA